MKKLKFSLPKMFGGLAILCSGMTYAQGPFTPIPDAVTSGYTHSTTSDDDCANVVAHIYPTFEMHLANFGGDGTYRVQIKFYKGDWVNAGMGFNFINETFLTSVNSPTMAIPALLSDQWTLTNYVTEDFFINGLPAQAVVKNCAYRSRSTLQKLISGVWTDIYTTPVSTGYAVLDVPPYSVMGDWAEVTHVQYLKMGSYFSFSVNGNPYNGTSPTIITCASVPLIINNVLYGTAYAGTSTLTVETGTWNGTGTTFTSSTTSSITFVPTNADQNLPSLFPFVTSYVGSLRITYKLPNFYCNSNGITTATTRSMIVTVANPTFLNDYKALCSAPTSTCPSGVSVSKHICTTWSITSTMPSSSNLPTFKCQIKSALGWSGASKAGLAELAFYGSLYTVDVYEVDPTTGNRTGPSIYLNSDVATVGGLPLNFNDQGYGSGFDPSAAYYVDGTADATGSNGTGNFFTSYYNWAKSSLANITAMSAKVFCAEVKQFPAGGCTVSMNSYFRIANNGVNGNGAGARLAGPNDDELTEEESLVLDVYPNPTTGAFTIPVTEDDQQVSLTVMDNLGKKVLTVNDVKATNGNIHLENLANGIYLYAVTKDGTIYRGKIIKQ